MAALGAAASIVTLAQTAKDLYDLLKSIDGAPTYILDIAEDVRVLQNITEQIEYDDHASSTQLASAVEAMALCKLKMQKLELLLADLGLHTSSKRQRTWGSIKTVRSKEKIEALRSSVESAKTTLGLAQVVFTGQATKRDVAMLVTGINNIRTQQATRESVLAVTGLVERVRENLADQKNNINTIIASQRGLEQHVTEVHSKIDQAVARFGSISDSLAQPFIRNVLKKSIIAIAREAFQDPTLLRELSRIVSTPRDTALQCVVSASANDSHERLNRPPSATATNTLASRLKCYYFKRYNSIFGTVDYSTKVIQQNPYGDVSENSTRHKLETRFIVRLAPWLMRFGLEFISTKIFDVRSHSLRTFRTVPNDALIFEFCRDGNVRGIRSLFQRGVASPFDRNELGWTPLHYAAFRGEYRPCAILIEAGAEVDATVYSSDCTPLSLFGMSDRDYSETERTTTTRLLVQKGNTDLTVTDGHRRSVFHTSYVSLEWLLHNEGLFFDPHQTDQYGNTALMSACSKASRNPKEIKMLIEAGSDVNARNEFGHDAVSLCLQYSKWDRLCTAKLRILLQAGAKHHMMRVPLQAGAKHHMRPSSSWTHTVLALTKPQNLRCCRDALLSSDEFDLTDFLNAELENGMPLWKDGWTIQSLHSIFRTPSAELKRQEDEIRLEERNPPRQLHNPGKTNSWARYLDNIKTAYAMDADLPHLGIVTPKRKVSFVSPKPRRYFTLRKVRNGTSRQMRWSVYRYLPKSLREYRVCILPCVVG